MSLRPRYTYRRKAQHLAALARMSWDSIRPVLELAIPTARIILTRRYIDQETTR